MVGCGRRPTDLTMETTMTVKRDKGGKYAKGTRSPNPNGRPKKATVSESTSLAKEFISFANTPQNFIKNGQPVSQSPRTVVAERFFSDAISGKASPERFLRFLNEAEAAERKRHEEFLQDAVGYKLFYTAFKKRQSPGTPWDSSIGPDPDLLLIEDGQVINLDPLFADQEQRMIDAVYFQTWQDRRNKAEADLQRLRDLRAKATEPCDLYSLDDDIELTTYILEAARYMLNERDDRPARLRPWKPFPGEIPYDPEVEGPIDLVVVNADMGGSDDGSAEA